MSELVVTKTRFHAGVWEGVVRGSADGDPDLRVMHDDRPVAAVQLQRTDTAGEWTLRIPVPQEAVADGVQTVLIYDGRSDTKLADFTLIGGEAVADDLRAEITLLRAELDMLKRAFRRHCVETT